MGCYLSSELGTFLFLRIRITHEKSTVSRTQWICSLNVGSLLTQFPLSPSSVLDQAFRRTTAEDCRLSGQPINASLKKPSILPSQHNDPMLTIPAGVKALLG